ncbi:RNB domain-containing ribonuclease [soil metagenome]
MTKISHFADDARRAMAENGFEPAFSSAVREQVQYLSDAGAQDLSEGSIIDLRSTEWSSIDNRTSRDLDQVEWAEALPNGDIRILVGIADVDAYVEKDSPIDRRAEQNTVTVYTEGHIFPMLPEELSTDLTSLNEGEDRLAVIADMTVKANGDVPESTFYRAWVRNHVKLSYDEVAEWLDGDRGSEDIKRFPWVAEQIRLQDEAAVRLHKYRIAKGALEFESIESKVVLEGDEIAGLVSQRPNRARKLIENFMVASNVEMAEFLERHGWASLRRVVRLPDRWDGIRRLAAGYGYSLPAEPDRLALAEFLEERRNKDPETFPDLSLSIVKLIGSGEYVVERLGEDAGGHFGLAVDDYAHSTAPNRRFTDLVIQRLVKELLAGQKPPYSNEELDKIALHCNDRERAARKVERKMRKVIAATVMRKHVGESFDAIVTGVTASGTFARILRPPVDGRIERGERGLDVGEKVRVRLVSADPRRGFIDFEAIRP